METDEIIDELSEGVKQMRAVQEAQKVLMDNVHTQIEKACEIAIHAIGTDGVHHKQYFFEEILIALGMEDEVAEHRLNETWGDVGIPA